MKKIAVLFLTFFKIGAFTFGGGYAMIALLKNEFVAGKRWLKEDMFFDMVAIAESTPGPVAINSATYIGYHVAGFWGALASTVAVCIPSFAIIFLISLYFEKFLKLTYVSYALEGIQACVIYLIGSAGVQMIRTVCGSLWDKTAASHCLYGYDCVFTVFVPCFGGTLYCYLRSGWRCSVSLQENAGREG
jgi:chromate transporter